MVAPHALRALLGRNMIENIIEEAGGSIPPSQAPAPMPAAQLPSVQAPAASSGAPDLVYTYAVPGMDASTVFDMYTRQPVQVYISDGYIPLIINGEGTGAESMVSQNLMNIARSVPPLRGNRGELFQASVYVSAAAAANFRPASYDYMAPVASYSPQASMNQQPPATLPPGASSLSPAIPSWASGGRQQATDRTPPASLVTAPPPPSAAPPVPPPAVFTPQTPSAGTQAGWSSDDGSISPNSGGGAPAPAPASDGKGWLILAAIAAAVLSQ